MFPEKISYQIIFTLNKTIDVQIGKLGNFNFPAGKYIYTGSAKKNISQRIQRHQSKSKKLHWHIDYLLCQSEVTIQDILKSELDECKLNQSTAGKIIVPGFGSSDCRNGCISHLKYQS
ncbi:MAG TPA: GIY-YIG nuclease family protein [Caldithrix sp.]|nr:GIY-YIG nuclease family protein [Calditrichaceae bacterium]HEM49526.1 GIY-YIG nuclease family protein [Caldithrix sp.]